MSLALGGAVRGLVGRIVGSMRQSLRAATMGSSPAPILWLELPPSPTVGPTESECSTVWGLQPPVFLTSAAMGKRAPLADAPRLVTSVGGVSSVGRVAGGCWHWRLLVTLQAVVSYCVEEQVEHHAHARLLASLQAVVSYAPTEQVEHGEHPE